MASDHFRDSPNDFELWPVVLSFARRGVNGGADAQDVAQEVFLRICSRIADFDRSPDGLSWAFGIASYDPTWKVRAWSGCV